MQIVEQRRLRDQERFEENRRFEEMTDIAERLGYPIDTTISYTLRGKAVYAKTDTVDRPFHNQTLQAKLQGSETFVGDQAFEYERLSLEHDEALQVDQLAAGKLPGNVLIKFSKVPDAVVENRTSINGYRRDLLRSFVRVYYRTPDGVDCRLFTLDHNHQAALSKAGDLLGIDTTRPSEEVLADYALLDVSHDLDVFVADLTSATINAYDQSVHATTGEKTHAGSHYIDRQNAMEAVTRQPQLVSQHMDAVATIVGQGLNPDATKQLLEAARERSAAAIKLSNEGHVISSSSDASVSAEVETGNYGGECATANGMAQASTQNMENVWSHGECQVCFAKTMVGSCMVCSRCAAADDRGVDLLELRDKNLRRISRQGELAQRAISPELKPPKTTRQTSKAHYVKQVYGEHARLERRIVIGGRQELAIDRSGQVLGIL